MKLGLRGKILGAAVFLLVPLAVTLTFLYQYGTAQIRFSTMETYGIKVTAPLMDALFSWQTMGVDGTLDPQLAEHLQAYAVAMAPLADDLSYNEETMKAAGYGWNGTEALGKLVKTASEGNYGQFAAVHANLMADLKFAADSSGLVLDPDLDSYYLVLASYQALPAVLDGITTLRAQTRPYLTKLDEAARLRLFAQAQELANTVGELQDSVERSLKAEEASGQKIDGYSEAMNAELGPLVFAAGAVRDQASQDALSATYDPKLLDALLTQLIPKLRDFQLEAYQALGAIIEHRIAGFRANLTTAFGTALVGLALAVVTMLLVIGGVRRRAFQLMRSLGEVAQGDLRNEVPSSLLKSGDELGRLAKSVRILQNDLKIQVKSIEDVTARLSGIGSTLASNTEESASAIEEMSATSSHVARHAQSQLDQTTRAGNEIDSMVQRITESNSLTQGMATQFFLFSQSMESNRRRIQTTAAEARTSGDLAQGLKATGDGGEASLEALRASIGSVVKRTAEIQEIVSFILDISDRTNLLSMNAAIEAAHAGASGRGFAVVAEEIRKLAVSSSRQAQGIKDLVDGISEATEQTLAKSSATSQSFKSLKEDIEAVRHASQAIAEQMALQEAEDARLSDGLVEFTAFYGRLSESMEVQVGQSETVHQAIRQLENASQEISQSMDEQKIGMGQATEAVIQVRDTTNELAAIMENLAERVSRFRT